MPFEDGNQYNNPHRQVIMETGEKRYDGVKYINIGYLLSQIGNTNTVKEKNALELKSKVDECIPDDIIEMLVVDMENIVTLYEGIDGKSSYLKLVFDNIERTESIKRDLFANCLEETANFLREKDFPASNKVVVLSFEYDSDFLRSCKNALNDEVKNEVKAIVFSGLEDTEKIKDACWGYISGLISKKIKLILSQNKCIEDLADKGMHILSSTPVHVNKYVNLKPVLENHIYYQEVCYLLYRQIINKCSTPDYIVASSRNSIYLASGLLRYFQTADMIIIDQISPITQLSNFSNIDDINPKRSYAIIEDFCCMGTEIKTVKSVLWSRGVDVEQDCNVFPVVSTNLYGEMTNERFKAQRIYPLYILEKTEDYFMFTNNCCPICNGIECVHSRQFNLK